MVADEPVEPQPARAAARGAGRERRGAVRRAGRGVRRRGPRLRAGAGRRRLPLPEPPRPRALRRALRARGPVGTAVGRGARDAGDRRLQAADLRGAGRGDPRRQRRRRRAHAAAARLHRAIGRDPGPGQAVLYGTTPLFLEQLGLDSLDDLPPLGDFVPGAEVVEALETTLRPAGPDEPATSADHATPRPRAAGRDCRRCWHSAASAAGVTARS